MKTLRYAACKAILLSRPTVLQRGTAMALLSLALASGPALAREDIQALLEILMEKGIITQEEFDAKIKKARAAEEIRTFNETQDIRRATREIDKRAEEERKFKLQFSGAFSSGYYNASNMKGDVDASGLSDQPKGNNRIGVKAIRQIDDDITTTLTLESNFSTRTGAVGRDAANTGSNNGALFDREASFRISSKTWGTLQLGRGPTLQNDLAGAFDARSNWNFGGLKPIARYAGFHSASGLNRADRLVRYSSPAMHGFTVDTGISFGNVPGDSEQATTYQIGGRYKQGNVEMAYNHIEGRISASGNPTPTTQTEVNNRVDFIAAKYTIDALTLNAGYAITRNPENPAATLSASSPGGRADVDTLFTGALYRFSPTLSANAGWYQVMDKKSGANGLNDVQMLATGVMWAPYKDWEFFVDYALARRRDGATAVFTLYDSWRPDTGAPTVSSAGTKNQQGISLGAQYRF